MSPVDVLWTFLCLCFLGAFCFHGNRRFATCRVYVVFQDLIRYGKTKQNLQRDDWLRVFDVPKRWFWHFYVVSVSWNGFLLVVYLDFIRHQSLPPWLTWTVDVLTGGPNAHTQVPQLSTVLVQLLLSVHSLRRLHECLWVSVFSDSSMHLVQYLFGLGYYIILGLTVLCSDRTGTGTDDLLSQLNWVHVAGLGLFMWSSLLQHQSLVLLARLRMGKSGTVETRNHRVPEGGWFHLVSCPHYFAELLIYVSLSLVFGGCCWTWWLVVLYVFFNQALAGRLCHELYISKYKCYPQHRRAFIPYVL